MYVLLVLHVSLSRTHKHTHTHTHTHTQTHTHTHTNTNQYAPWLWYTRAHTHTRTHIHAHTHKSTHIDTHINKRTHKLSCEGRTFSLAKKIVFVPNPRAGPDGLMALTPWTGKSVCAFLRWCVLSMTIPWANLSLSVLVCVNRKLCHFAPQKWLFAQGQNSRNWFASRPFHKLPFASRRTWKLPKKKASSCNFYVHS